MNIARQRVRPTAARLGEGTRRVIREFHWGLIVPSQ
jgi:hypothetical protein